MNADDIAAKQSAQREIEKWLNHPITKRLTTANDEAQAAFQLLVMDTDIVDIQSLVNHFVAIGHYRGLRQSAADMTNELQEIREELEKAK